MSVLGNGGIGSIKKQIFLVLGLFFSSSHLGAVSCPQTVGAMSINEGIWNVLTRIGAATNVIESQICALGTGSGNGVTDLTCSFTFGQADVGAGNIYTISVPGIYCMTQNITFSFGTAIRVASSDVTINMEGHTLNGANNALAVAGIRLENFISNVTIQNGIIENINASAEFYAIRDSGSVASIFNASLVNIVINNVNFNNNWGSISLGALADPETSLIDGILIENCNFFGTLQADIALVSISSIVRNCQLQSALEILAPDVTAGTFYALIEDCVVTSTGSQQAAIIVESDNVVVRNCIVQGAANQGIQVNGNAVAISDCTIQGGDTSVATNGLSLVTGPEVASVALIERCVVADSCGFNIDFAGNSLKLVDCVAQNSAFDGFNILSGRSIIFERCAAQVSVNNGFVAQIYGIGGLGGPEDIIFNDCQAVANGVCGFLLVTPSDSGTLASLTSAAFNNCVAEFNGGDGFNLDNITGVPFANISFNACVAQRNLPGGRFYGTSQYFADGFGVNSATNGGRQITSTINNVVFTSCVSQNNVNNGFNFGDAANNVDTISCQDCTAQQNTVNGMNFSSTSTNCEVYMCLLTENGTGTSIGYGIYNLNANFGPLPSSANSFLANRSFNNGPALGFDYFQINDGVNGQPFFSQSTEASVQGASAWANMAT